MSDVSLNQGHDSLAKPSVTAAPAPFTHHGSLPILVSQYRGPHIYNMAETDEEKAKREEAERKAEEDEKAKSNFKKVQEAREAEKARADAAEAKLREREEADKKAAEAKLAEEKKFEELAKAKEKEAEDARAEAAAAKAEAEKANGKLKQIEEQQEKELTAILDTIPEAQRPPLDPTDPVEKRLAQAKYAQSLLGKGPKPAVGAGVKKDEGDGDRLKVLLETQKSRPLTPEESEELMSLSV